MSTITVRLNNEEERIYKEYAEFKNIPLSTLMNLNYSHNIPKSPVSF